MKYHSRRFREGEGEGGGEGGQGGEGGEGFQAPELGSVLSPEFKDNAALADFNNPDALAKSYLELKQYQGNSVHIPGQDASDEARAAFNEKLMSVPGVMLKPDFDNPEQSNQFYESIGKPKEMGDYKYSPPENVAADNLDDARITQFQNIAHKHNLTKKQFQGVIGDIVASDMAQAGVSAKSMEEDKATLVGEWGEAYTQNMKIAQNVAQLTGAPETVIQAMKDGGTNSGFNKWLFSLSKKMGGGEGMNFHEEGSGETKMTPMEAKEKISEIMNNKEHPYWMAADPAHKDSINKMVELQRVANPAQ